MVNGIPFCFQKGIFFGYVVARGGDQLLITNY